MKRLSTVLVSTIGGVVLLGLVIFLVRLQGNPSLLLWRLEHGHSKEEIAMRLNMSRSDVVAPETAAVSGRCA